jgi:hypothetical protein
MLPYSDLRLVVDLAVEDLLGSQGLLAVAAEAVVLLGSPGRLAAAVVVHRDSQDLLVAAVALQGSLDRLEVRPSGRHVSNDIPGASK